MMIMNCFISSRNHLKNCNKCTMEVRRLKLNDLNPAFMKNLFAKREISKRRKNKVEIRNRNTVKYGDKSIRSLGPHIWNGFPRELKNENCYDKFKEYSNTWYWPKFTCSLCSFTEINTLIETKTFSVKYSLRITLLLELLPSVFYYVFFSIFFFIS